MFVAQGTSRPRFTLWLVSCLASCFLLGSSGGGPAKAEPQAHLQTTFGAHGIEKLVYQGIVLEDLSRFPNDEFHIWHMKCTDLHGNPLTVGQYGWGENHNSRTWNAADHSWTYVFQWGAIRVQFAQAADSLQITVKETNRAGSGVVLQGATIYPLALHLSRPSSDLTSTGNTVVSNMTEPGVAIAGFAQGVVASVNADASKPLYNGFQASGADFTYTPIVSSTTPDSLASFQPHFDRPVRPGETDTFSITLRFAPKNTPLSTIAADAYRAWAKTWPAQIVWPDRRIIGTVFLASSPQGDPGRSAGPAWDPRRYFQGGTAQDFDIRTPEGLRRFQNRILRQAHDVARNLARLQAQGAVTWDIEGEAYPMNTSYLCAPDQIAALSPEMESEIVDASSGYRGTKLVDAYFAIIRQAGFRVGVCVRPQRLTVGPDGTAAQISLTDPIAVKEELLRKIRYARDRWSATLFYIDSAVDRNGAPLSPSILQNLHAALPDVLLIPEQNYPRDYAYAAPFQSFLFHDDEGTSPNVRSYYPQAFSAILVNDVDAGKLQAHRESLQAAFEQGDILMVHADSWHPNNDTVKAMYRLARTH